MNRSRIAVVVPAFNEASRLELPAFARFLTATEGTELLFVDDGSTDDTPVLLREFVASHPARSAVLALERNGGKAEAVRRGVLQVLEADPAPDAVGYLDADLAAPLEAMVMLREELDGDPALWAVLGSRVQLLGRQVTRSALRHYLGRVFATAASLTLAVPVYDTQCGCKLFRNRPEVHRAFAVPFASRWIFDVELLARLLGEAGPPVDGRCREVPLERWSEAGRSSVGITDFLRAPFELLAIRRRHPPSRRP